MTDRSSLTVAELARHLGAPFEGNGTRELRNVEPLESAGPQTVSWLGSPKYAAQLATTNAACVLVPPDCAVPPDKTVIRVADPDLAMCETLRCLAPPAETVPTGIHPTATIAEAAVVEGAALGAHVYVGPSAVVGPGTQLHPGVCVGRHARIGRDCTIWPNVVIREHVIIGDRVIIHPNTTIGADGFSYLQRDGRHVKIPQIGTVVIEDDVEIGANTAIDRARSGETRIRRGTKIDNLVQIAHNCDIGEDCIIVGQCGISGSVTLGSHVVLAGRAGVADHRKIGDGAQLAATALATRDVPAGRIYRGDPATEIAQFGRQQVIIRRLPRLAKELRDLIRRVEQLESSADHPKRS